MTEREQMVEEVARAEYEGQYHGPQHMKWEAASPSSQRMWRHRASAGIDALLSHLAENLPKDGVEAMADLLDAAGITHPQTGPPAAEVATALARAFLNACRGDGG